jgi:hypothetical protein
MNVTKLIDSLLPGLKDNPVPEPGTPNPPDDRHIPDPGVSHPLAGQKPGEATPDTKPGDFIPTEARTPAGGFSPTLGVGDSFQGGVTPLVTPEQPDRYSRSKQAATHRVIKRETKPGVSPVPVIIVPPDSDPKVRRSGSTNNVSVGITAVQLLERDLHRSAVWILNEDPTNGIRIGFSQSHVTSWHGYLLMPGKMIGALSSQTEIWAILDGVNQTAVQVSVLSEFGIVEGTT